MKALMYVGERRLQVQEAPKPEEEFLIRVAGCAICGTDLKTYLHGHPFFKPPTILGHEFYGTVEKAPAASGYKPGDWVAAAPYGDCGACEACRAGNPELCKNKDYVETGAFCEYVAVPLPLVERGVVRLPSPDPAYALTEPLSCVLAAMGQLDIRPDDQVLIIGGGPMGALFAMTLMDMGVSVRVAELNELRRNCLTAWSIPNAPLEDCRQEDCDKIVVAVNKKELVEQAVPKVKDGGAVHVFAGLPSGTMLSVPGHDLHYRKVRLLGSSGFSIRHFHDAFARIAAKPAHYASLITHTFPMERGQEAFELLQSGGAFKILVTP